MKKIILIGCGGVGSWLAPALIRIKDPTHIILVDGDTLERKNLDRQLFNEAHIGQNKARALSHLYGTGYEPNWFSMGSLEIYESDLLIVAVDNHPARLAAFQECDSSNCSAICAANETYSAEAFYYQPQWQGSPLDPRVYYPEIRTDRSGDPQARAIGCTGEAQEQNRQLATANFTAAALALQLLTIWTVTAPAMKREDRKHLPFKLNSNLTKNETHRIKDVVIPERTTQ